MYINKSVGRGAINNKKDVLFVQELLNLASLEESRIPALVVDGKIGKNTIKAIYLFQKYLVKLKAPDSRIDPDGRSEKTLVAKAIELDIDAIPDVLIKHNISKPKVSAAGSGPRNIHYRSSAKKVVSAYSENIIRLAMAYGNINKCDFSSTIRTFSDQARIMYNNCSSYPSATSVSTLVAARGWGYGKSGREVEEVYYKNKTKPKDELIQLMKDKVVELYDKGKKVSLHCVPESDYKKKNVLDIPYSSVPVNNRKSFEIALMGMSNKIRNARYKKPLQGELYITRLIIEDKCWHIEIAQDNKPLPNAKKPAAPNKKKHMQTVATKTIRNYVVSFLDEWF